MPWGVIERLKFAPEKLEGVLVSPHKISTASNKVGIDTWLPVFVTYNSTLFYRLVVEETGRMFMFDGASTTSCFSSELTPSKISRKIKYEANRMSVLSGMMLPTATVPIAPNLVVGTLLLGSNFSLFEIIQKHAIRISERINMDDLVESISDSTIDILLILVHKVCETYLGTPCLKARILLEKIITALDKYKTRPEVAGILSIYTKPPIAP